MRQASVGAVNAVLKYSNWLVTRHTPVYWSACTARNPPRVLERRWFLETKTGCVIGPGNRRRVVYSCCIRNGAVEIVGTVTWSCDLRLECVCCGFLSATWPQTQSVR